MRNIRTSQNARIYRSCSFISVLVSVLVFSACSKPDLPVAPQLDTGKFMGKWFEIAAFPENNKKGCKCNSVDFKLSPERDYIMVINSCIKKGKQGAVLAKAFINENSGNSKWEMQYFWPFNEDYYIITVAEDYSYALTGSPSKDKLWILCRQPELDANVYSMLVNYAGELGFETARLIKINHECNGNN